MNRRVRKRKLRYHVVAWRVDPWVPGPNEQLAVVAACRTLEEARLRLDEAAGEFAWLAIIDRHSHALVKAPRAEADQPDAP